MPAIGFVILVNPFSPLEQTSRLIRKLNEMFNCPPIACHFDFGKNPAELPKCPPNVKIVRPHIDTKWADFSCIEAAISAIRLLYADDNGPDWFVYLSGADYPIKPAAHILAELQASPFDAHIEHRLIQFGRYENWWQKACHKRFCSIKISLPWITKRMTFMIRSFWVDYPLIAKWFLPYSQSFACYAGEAWFCANKKSASSICNFYDRDTALAAHCRKILVPEETYFHTVLANDSQLKLSQNHLRYVDWTAFGSHPKTLTQEDVPKMIASTAHFARKFDHYLSSSILKELDLLNG